MVVNEIKIRLLRLEKRQVDLLDAIRRGDSELTAINT